MPGDARAEETRLAADRRDSRVSHYVKPGDALDIEAQNRSTSVYFPARVIDASGEAVQRPVFAETRS